MRLKTVFQYLVIFPGLQTTSLEFVVFAQSKTYREKEIFTFWFMALIDASNQ